MQKGLIYLTLVRAERGFYMALNPYPQAGGRGLMGWGTPASRSTGVRYRKGQFLPNTYEPVKGTVAVETPFMRSMMG
jgi:hypothetical protein